MNTIGLPIEIEEVLNGYIVTIGCMTVIIEGQKSIEEAQDRLFKELKGYFANRTKVEAEWMKRFEGAKRGPFSGRMRSTSTTTVPY